MTVRFLMAAAAVGTLSVTAASAQTIDDLIAKNLKAKGGVERLKAVKGMKISGKVMPAPGVEIPLTIISERPNKIRQESNFQGQQMVTAFDGTTAWQINPMMGITTPTEITGPQFEMLKDQADLDGPFLDYKAKGITLELQGTEEVDGAKTHKIKVTRKSGQSQMLFLDAETGLEVKAVNEVVQGDMRLTVESLFSNYQKVDGIVLAHTITQKISGPATQTMSITVDKAEVVDDVDDSLFKMPAKQ